MAIAENDRETIRLYFQEGQVLDNLALIGVPILVEKGN